MKSTIKIIMIMVLLALTSTYAYSSPFDKLKSGLDDFGLGDMAYSDQIKRRIAFTLYNTFKSYENFTYNSLHNFVKKMDPKEPRLDWHDAREYRTSVMTSAIDKSYFKLACGSVSVKYIAGCLGGRGYSLDAIYLRGVDEGDISVDWFKSEYYADRFIDANESNLEKLREYYVSLDVEYAKSELLELIEKGRLSAQREKELQVVRQQRANAFAKARARKNEELYEADRRVVSKEKDVFAFLRKRREAAQRESGRKFKEANDLEVRRVNLMKETAANINTHRKSLKKNYWSDARKNYGQNFHKVTRYIFNDQCRAAGKCNNLTYTMGKIHPFTKGYERWDILESDYKEIANTLRFNLEDITGIKLMTHQNDRYIAFKYHSVWFVHELIDFDQAKDDHKYVYHQLGIYDDLWIMWKKYSQKIGIT